MEKTERKGIVPPLKKGYRTNPCQIHIPEVKLVKRKGYPTIQE